MCFRFEFFFAGSQQKLIAKLFLKRNKCRSLFKFHFFSLFNEYNRAALSQELIKRFF